MLADTRLTLNEVAARLGCTVQKVGVYIRTGDFGKTPALGSIRLPSFRERGTVFVAEADLLEWQSARYGKDSAAVEAVNRKAAERDAAGPAKVKAAPPKLKDDELSLCDVAARYRVSTNQVQGWVVHGYPTKLGMKVLLPVRRDGRHTTVVRDVLDRWDEVRSGLGWARMVEWNARVKAGTVETMETTPTVADPQPAERGKLEAA